MCQSSMFPLIPNKVYIQLLQEDKMNMKVINLCATLEDRVKKGVPLPMVFSMEVFDNKFIIENIESLMHIHCNNMWIFDNIINHPPMFVMYRKRCRIRHNLMQVWPLSVSCTQGEDQSWEIQLDYHVSNLTTTYVPICLCSLNTKTKTHQSFS